MAQALFEIELDLPYTHCLYFTLGLERCASLARRTFMLSAYEDTYVRKAPKLLLEGQ